MKTIIMPKFGFTMEEGELVRWLKHDGDWVEKGEPIAEVTTDKINMEIEAPMTGTLAGLKLKEGDRVPVTQVIGYILQEGESLTNLPSVAKPASEKPGGVEFAAKSSGISPLAQKIATAQGLDISRVQGTGIGGRITKEDVERAITNANEKTRATPAARHWAKQHAIELANVRGSGPAGRIQVADVQNVQNDKPITPPLHMPQNASPNAVAVPLSNMRKTIAARLQKSAQEAPHITFDIDIDMTSAEALRGKLNARLAVNAVKISMSAILIKTVAWVLRRHPKLNSQFDLENNCIWQMNDINLGMAVALDDGLIVPVIHNADQKTTAEVANAIADVTVRARQNKLKPNDLSGGTFSISNLGMFGLRRFSAIINPPECAILAVGSMSKRVVVDENNALVIRPVLTLSLSCDHRVVDGADAARFLAELQTVLQSPELML